jgi:uncharacterized damage-inducible protein DinB
MANEVDLKAIAFGDVQRELGITRKVLERVPEKHFDWKPHEKSLSLMRLAIHVAYLPEWARDTLESDVLDVASAPRPPERLASTQEILGHFDRNAAGLAAAIEAFDMGNWGKTWSLRKGDQVMTAKPRPFAFRVWCINHMIHHRAQVNVYLRLLNVPVATIYFNSADDPTWLFD